MFLGVLKISLPTQENSLPMNPQTHPPPKVTMLLLTMTESMAETSCMNIPLWESHNRNYRRFRINNRGPYLNADPMRVFNRYQIARSPVGP